MTIVADIIRDAFRESNINAINVNPTAAQQEEALRLLNRLVSSVYGNEAGEQFIPMDLGSNNIQRPQGYPWVSPEELADWYVPENTRLMLNLVNSTTVYLPPLPQDGARFAVVDKSNNLAIKNLVVVGNGRSIENATQLTLNTNGYRANWFYRDDTGNWAKVSPLLQFDDWPFPEDFDDFFVIALALRLNPRNGAALSPESMEVYKDGLRNFKARYSQTHPQPAELALFYPNMVNRYYGMYGGDAGNSLFEVGYPFYPGLWRR